MTIRAHKVHQEGVSFTSKIGHLFGSFKEKTTDYVEKAQTDKTPRYPLLCNN